MKKDNGCKEYVGLVWMTLERVPSAHGKRKRWSETDAVDHLFAERWKGFVQLICNAYFSKRMVWYPLDRYVFPFLCLHHVVFFFCSSLLLHHHHHHLKNLANVLCSPFIPGCS